ncbi:metal ABC transporter substrate-binding protein [Pedococcus sp. 5OH_020]|uniref:metal ABC transporter substrate-binding protein n=1 Tax=Pedococcus sp. 5OH_020 TaxID=2989814 RepID=UPI0022E9BAB4|nr:metal ABC transporter substrate-binding protein [Pedococcus sp. 5OH_020]
MTYALLRLAATSLAVALAAACGTSGSSGGAGDKLTVVAAFYPLEYAASQVGGGYVSVKPLTKPGAEPHDLELTPRQVADVAQADVVVYERGFQPAVDAAVARQARHRALDVAPAARLTLTLTEDDHSDDHAGEPNPTDLTKGAPDPHFWLDPLRYADVGDAIAGELAAKDPSHADSYRANAQAFRATLTSLDAELRTGLSRCRLKDLVTSHAAFGYLARAYGLRQYSITGLSPEGEPSPTALARLAALIRETGATTVYAETLVSQDVAKTLVRETGARMAVLDPVEGITSVSSGHDYPAVMRADLTTLRAGQECS